MRFLCICNYLNKKNLFFILGVPSPSTNAALGGSPSSNQNALSSSSPPPPTASPTVVKPIELNMTPVKINHIVHPQITTVTPIPSSNFTNSTGISPSRAQQPAPSTSPSDWTIEEVIQFIETNDPILAVHAELFRKHVSLVSISMRFSIGRNDGKFLESFW